MSIVQILMLIIAVCTSVLQNMGIPIQVSNREAPRAIAASEVVASPTPLVIAMPSPTPKPAPARWTHRLWVAGEGNGLFYTETPNAPDTFQFDNQLGGDFYDDSLASITDLATDSKEVLWILSGQSLYKFDDTHLDNVVHIVDIAAYDAEGNWLNNMRIRNMAFDAEGTLWVIGNRRIFAGTFKDDKDERLRVFSQGRISAEIEVVSDMTFHGPSLVIVEDRKSSEDLDRLFEVPDPLTPETVINRGTFPGDLGSPSEIVSDGKQLWILDKQRGANEFWRVSDIKAPARAVEIGNISIAGEGSIHQPSALAFQRVLVTEQFKVPATPGDMWLASRNALYKLSEGGDLQTVEEVGALEGYFVNDLQIVSIDFDSEGQLYILANHIGGGKHKLYRLDNAANPRDAYVFSDLEGVTDGLGQIKPLEVVVDAQDRVWVYDNDYTDAYLVTEATEELISLCPEDVNRCIVPDTFADGKGYALNPFDPGRIYSLADFADPRSYVEVGQLPESLYALTAGAQAFWGLDREGIEQHLWLIADIETPGTAVKFGEFGERLPAFVDMAVYRPEK